MKRYLFVLWWLFCCLALHSQSQYTCRYWFDNSIEQSATINFNENTWETELDVANLSDGLHVLQIQVMDTSMVWGVPKNYLFLKVSAVQPPDLVYYWFDTNTDVQIVNFSSGNLLLDVATLDAGLHTLNIAMKSAALAVTQSYLFMKYAGDDANTVENVHCWFDGDRNTLQTFAFGNGSFLVDVNDLDYGVHTVNIALDGDMMLPTKSYLFMKLVGDDSNTVESVHCWFDGDITTLQTFAFGNGSFLVDVNDLDYGVHTVNIALKGSTILPAKNYLFMKIDDDSAVEKRYRCWFDNNYDDIQSGLVGEGGFLLDVEELSNGFHTVNIQIEKGTLSTPQSFMFYKRPVGGNIARWEYWINGDITNRHLTKLTQYVDTLDIISLLPVEPWPVRSTCFHFHPNGDEPYINAKNEITFRFWDGDYNHIEKSAFYVDESISQTIVADTLGRNTTVSIDAPRDNQIKWFMLEANRGDYMSFVADKACSMQLFTPSGEEIINVTGVESLLATGSNVWEDGAYYLAVHDVTGSGEMVSITYNWLYRYTISSYDVHIVGNGGCSTITFKGNGFNNLLDAYYVSESNDTIRSLDIGHESNTETTVSCNFYEENLGVYDAVFEFWEETIRINGALQVDEPEDIYLTSTVSYPTSFMSGTTVTYDFKITNNGNMSAYVVPIYMNITSPKRESITHIEIEGLDLPKLIDYIDLDSLTMTEIEDLRTISKEFGDDHNFFMFPELNNTGDTISYMRTTYFFVNIAPYETKTVKLKITATTGAHQPIGAWVIVPGDAISPLTFLPDNRGVRDVYCCAKNWMTCGLDVICFSIDLIDLVVGVIPGIPHKVAVSVASCFCDILSLINTQLSLILCEDNTNVSGFWDMMHRMNYNSMIGAAASCFKKKLLKNLGLSLNIYKTFQLLNKLKTMLMVGLYESAYDCSEPMMGPIDCLKGELRGGQTDGQTPGDPNDIFGYTSESGSHYMRQEIQNIHYEIEFENDTTLATAAAHTIIVRDTLDATKFDLNSLAAHSVTLGSKRLELNGEQTFAKTLDMRPELYVIAQIEQDYDPMTGVIAWTIQSLDPMTMEPTDNPFQGVLPVNYFGDGVGFIDYSVNLKQTFADGTEISNRAGIIFDQEDLIMTPTWTNIVDAVAPTSQIVDVTQVADTLNFTFESEDNRSGVWYHTLYFRNESIEMDWKVKKSQILGNTYPMVLDDLQTTEYFVVATDSAGNKENKFYEAEYVYVASDLALQENDLNQGWNWWSTYVEQNDFDGLTSVENSLGNNGVTIKSQNDFTYNYFEDVGYDYWFGGLETLGNEYGYMINTRNSCKLRVIGAPADPANHPITIKHNWNWIGYPVNQAQLLSTATVGFQPENEDVMKSQEGFTTYYEGYGWFPEDFVMTPGKGYMYMSNANANKTLTYSASREEVPEIVEQEHQWTPEVHKYADNISVIAVVNVNGNEISDNMEVGAFVNGECRGSAIMRYFAPTDRYYAMLSVSGTDDDIVAFKVLNSESDVHITFHSNDVVGTLDRPFVVEFKDSNDDFASMTLYPNPVNSDEDFAIVVPKWEKASAVTITNALGEVFCYESVKDTEAKRIDKAGVYMIKVTCESGNVYKNKLIVK